MRSAPLRLLCLASLLGAGLPAAAADPQHAAQCVAALRARADTLAPQALSGGDGAQEAALLQLLQRGYAFIGNAYLQGVDKERADAMLDEATRAQQRLPAAELARRQAGCEREGAALLADANALERAVVDRAAQSRLQRMKRKLAQAPATR